VPEVDVTQARKQTRMLERQKGACPLPSLPLPFAGTSNTPILEDIQGWLGVDLRSVQ
jgi:hypothetical protein